MSATVGTPQELLKICIEHRFTGGDTVHIHASFSGRHSTTMGSVRPVASDASGALEILCAVARCAHHGGHLRVGQCMSAEVCFWTLAPLVDKNTHDVLPIHYCHISVCEKAAQQSF